MNNFIKIWAAWVYTFWSRVLLNRTQPLLLNIFQFRMRQIAIAYTPNILKFVKKNMFETNVNIVKKGKQSSWHFWHFQFNFKYFRRNELVTQIREAKKCRNICLTFSQIYSWGHKVVPVIKWCNDNRDVYLTGFNISRICLFVQYYWHVLFNDMHSD